MVPLADSTIYEMEQRGEFPQRFYLTSRCVVWDLAEVEAWLQDECGALAVLWANRAKDVGRGGALVMRRRWACSATRPTPGDLVFLADARLIGEPDFYIGRIDAFVLGDLRHTRRETFLKSSIAPSACA